jgi:hypothetical protein
MTADQNGTYMPGWVFKAMQGLILTAVVGGYGMFYSMHDDIVSLKHKVETMEADVAKIEGKLDEREDAAGEIRESLAVIKAELPFIKQGINDLKGLLR